MCLRRDEARETSQPLIRPVLLTLHPGDAVPEADERRVHCGSQLGHRTALAPNRVHPGRSAAYPLGRSRMPCDRGHHLPAEVVASRHKNRSCRTPHWQRGGHRWCTASPTSKTGGCSAKSAPTLPGRPPWSGPCSSSRTAKCPGDRRSSPRSSTHDQHEQHEARAHQTRDQQLHDAQCSMGDPCVWFAAHAR